MPYSLDAMVAELSAYIRWYNECRPHESLSGLTPAERLAGSAGAIAMPRLEPRALPARRRLG